MISIVPYFSVFNVQLVLIENMLYANAAMAAAVCRASISTPETYAKRAWRVQIHGLAAGFGLKYGNVQNT